MTKKRLTVSLSRNSFQELSKSLNDYKNGLQKVLQSDIEKCTNAVYDEIIKNCEEGNFTIHHNNIICEPENGLIYTDDPVVIFNEFGTGVMGTQDAWANAFQYEVNQSGKGEEGWAFYNAEHGYGGITHGIKSKHMFYNAIRDFEPVIDEKINLDISRLTGNIYEPKGK